MVAAEASGPARTFAGSPLARRGTAKTSTDDIASTRAAEGSRLRAYLSMEMPSLRQVRIVKIDVVVHVVVEALELRGDRERVGADHEIADELLLEQKVVHLGDGGIGPGSVRSRPQLL